LQKELKMPGYIHHIEWCVSDVDALSDQLMNQFGFREISGRQIRTESGPDTFSVRQKVLKSGLTVFMLSEKKSAALPKSKAPPNNLVGQKSQIFESR
jgi:hypothetical protein